MRRAAWLLVLAAGCGDAKVSKNWSGLESRIQSPAKVEAWRIKPPDPPKDHAGAPPEFFSHSKYAETAGPVTVDAATSKQLAEILLDEKSYYRGPPKPCIPTPGVKFAFHPEKGVPVWVYLCLECRILFIYSGGAAHGADDFDPALPALVAIAKKLFPNDPELQAFK